jgi:hypothetical protein
MYDSHEPERHTDFLITAVVWLAGAQDAASDNERDQKMKKNHENEH